MHGPQSIISTICKHMYEWESIDLELLTLHKAKFVKGNILRKKLLFEKGIYRLESEGKIGNI